MNRLVLIDGHAILHRAYHALPPLTSKNGQVVNAVYGFVSMLLRVVNELKPAHLAVVFDRPEPTFRSVLFKDYQIQRPALEVEFVSQIDLVKKIINDMDIPIFEKAGFEADDVIGTIAKQTTGDKRIDEVIVVTSDRDLLQLVDCKVKLFMPVKGLNEGKLYGEKEAEERMGVVPSQIPDLKALMGDPSDNYPGVSGIGPKTAAALIKEFGSLKKVYKHLNKIKSSSIIAKLEAGEKDVILSQKLARVVCDVPVEFDINKARMHDLATEEAVKTLEELGFRSLIPRLSFNKQQTTDNRQQITRNKKQKEEKKNKQMGLF